MTWSRQAAEEAEAATTYHCSGHGYVFVNNLYIQYKVCLGTLSAFLRGSRREEQSNYCTDRLNLHNSFNKQNSRVSKSNARRVPHPLAPQWLGLSLLLWISSGTVSSCIVADRLANYDPKIKQCCLLDCRFPWSLASVWKKTTYLSHPFNRLPGPFMEFFHTYFSSNDVSIHPTMFMHSGAH